MLDTSQLPRFQTGLFIGGEFTAAADGAEFDVLNPHDNSVLTRMAEGGKEDIDRGWLGGGFVFHDYKKTF